MTSSETYTLINLLRQSGNVSKIEIPMIQRDYAQGRKSSDVSKIRSRFLESLYNSLTQKKSIKLDFVYGEITDNNTLIPLDGQQRLTTLFLLHWYIAKHENVDYEKFEFLKRFSYETRYSSRIFCQHLIDYKPESFTIESLSSDIIDQSWMPLDWKHDPTIEAMLNMLDDIHLRFRETSNLWETLEQGYVSFYFLSIKDMGLTDELYIKMNSRGMPLTEFEHFKAEWENSIKKQSPDVAARIGRKIDIDWTDILWPYKGDNNIIDDEFIRYFKYLGNIIYYTKYSSEKCPDDIFDLTKALFVEKESDALDNLHYIEDSFDCLRNVKIEDDFKRFLTNESHVAGKSHIEEELNVFEHCCRQFGERKSNARSFSLGRFILLYCFILYWKNLDKLGGYDFAKRLRIVNNMIKASEFELREDRMSSLLEQTKEIILDGEIKNVEGRNTFNALQVQEEIDKYNWLKSNQDQEERLHLLEDHPLLFGGIRVVGYENLKYTDRFYSLFECDKGLVNCALLTIGDYSLKIKWRYQIGSANIDTTWRTLFHTNKENIDKIHGILLQLLEKEDSFTNEKLKNIINNYIDNAKIFDWRYYIIKYSSMRPEKYGMYYWFNHQEEEKKSYNILMMLTEKSISGRNYNIFLKTLYDKILMDFPNANIRLGEYAYSNDGDMLEFKSQNKMVQFSDTEFIIKNLESDEIVSCCQIKQNENGQDIEDRIDVAYAEIKHSLLTI